MTCSPDLFLTFLSFIEPSPSSKSLWLEPKSLLYFSSLFTSSSHRLINRQVLFIFPQYLLSLFFCLFVCCFFFFRVHKPVLYISVSFAISYTGLGFDFIVFEMRSLPWMISTLPFLHPSVLLWVSLTFCPFTIVISCCQAAAVVPRCIEILDNRLYGGKGDELQVQSCLLAPS